MGCQMGKDARLILVTALSLTTLFYGPIVVIALSAIVLLYAHAVIGLKPQRTTRRKRPKPCASETRQTASRMTVNQWREAASRGGSEHLTEGR